MVGVYSYESLPQAFGYSRPVEADSGLRGFSSIESDSVRREFNDRLCGQVSRVYGEYEEIKGVLDGWLISRCRSSRKSHIPAEKVTIRVVTEPDGRRLYQVEWQHSRPVKHAIIAVYALPQGIVVDKIDLGGIGQPWNPPPIAGCVPVLMGSDSEGKFGRQCPACGGYWRSEGWTTICAYCRHQSRPHEFLTKAQQVYAARYCMTLFEALGAEADGDHVIDMDAVADAVGKAMNKPPFYYTEEKPTESVLVRGLRQL